MKIGAGGLQSLASQEVVPLRRIEPPAAVRREDLFPQGAPPPEEGGISKEELVAAVGRLNYAAGAQNQPLEFLVREERERLWVEVVDRQTGEKKGEVPPWAAIQAASDPFRLVGLLLDVYL
ncbi:flagellar protein FlaG [Desulfovirgula thermocuniculi]|uniref:flagellar protein FlaG n=1 Tax=Desulfovirgula thermocuniculi TaxID=348842 RepID=UPI0004110A0C|nr:flagellar protein FlaG [Desulfovirgula thermocuniculi]